MNLSNTPGISQLTHLQDLCLSGYYVDVNLVAPLTKLQKLEVEWVGASGGADQLLTLTGLIDLQQLAIRQQLEPVALSAESYAAVATSQQLTKLDLPWLEEGLVGQVFKVSRCPRLPKLQHLVGCMGWLSNTPGMRQVVNSCPNLQHLDLASMEVVAAEEFDARVYEKGLKALERLSMLTELKLWCGQVDMDMGVWGALARLTGLRRLELGYVSIVQSIGLLQLTTCRQLTQLTGGMLQTVPPFNLVSKVSCLGTHGAADTTVV